MPVKKLIGGTEYALSALTKSLGFLSRVVQVQINERIRSANGLPITPAVLSALRLIEANPGIRQVHAARIMMIQEPNMASMAKDLVERGLIDRRADAGRRAGFQITERGSALLEELVWVDDLDRSYAKALSDREYRQLLELLDKVYRDSIK